MNLDETSSDALSGEPVGYVLVSTSKNVDFHQLLFFWEQGVNLGSRLQGRIDIVLQPVLARLTLQEVLN